MWTHVARGVAESGLRLARELAGLRLTLGLTLHSVKRISGRVAGLSVGYVASLGELTIPAMLAMSWRKI